VAAERAERSFQDVGALAVHLMLEKDLHMAHKFLGKTRHRRMELRNHHGRHESCDRLNGRRPFCAGEAIPRGDSASVISWRMAGTEVDLSWSAIDRANDRRCCGYYGRVPNPRNNREFVLRETPTASAKPVWTFVGGRCYACGPIVRTLGEHGISKNVFRTPR
jgi:hypothetical protein